MGDLKRMIKGASERIEKARKNCIHKLERYSPPGWDVENDILWSIFLILIFILSFWFIYSVQFGGDLVAGTYSLANGELPVVHYRTLMSVMKNTLIFSLVIFIRTVITIISRYEFFKKGSQSIYLMKRLPDAAELHKRCMVLPLGVFFVTVILGATFVNIGIAKYYAVLPADAILDGINEYSFWRLIVCLY